MPSKHKWNVLVFPGGTEVGLEIWRSLRVCKEVRLFSCASGVANHAPYVYAHHAVIPGVDEPGWLEALNALVREHAIDFIFPAHAYVIDALNAARDRLACPAILASPEALSITRSKRRTYAKMVDSVPVPHRYDPAHPIPTWPVFAKPDGGYGGQGAQAVHTQPELDALLFRAPDTLVQEYLPGDEYTVDCFSAGGILLFCAARRRERIRMGTSMHGELADPPLQSRFRETAERILARIPLTGAWFFQMKEDVCGEPKLLEVEARIAGTMALNRARGVNFALLSLYQAAGFPVETMVNEGAFAIDRALINRYCHDLHYTTAYVDLDDTLLIHGRLNTELMQFLYQCVNKGVRLVLLSKSLAEDKVALLKRWRIAELWDEVHWLAEGDSKADYIDAGSAVFIDDSFSQRREVAARWRIPTFDASMIEALLDDHA